jgi:hypothetical protein
MISKRVRNRVTVAIMVCGFGTGLALAQAPNKAVESAPTKALAGEPLETPVEILEKLLGTWEIQARLWFEPGSEPVAVTGVAITEKATVQGYIQTRLKAHMLDELINGLGIDGYDEAREKYVSVWIDSTNPGIETFEGAYDPRTRAITSFGKKRDPETGKMIETKSVTTFKSKSMYTYQAWVKDQNGEWVKLMEMMAGRVN